MQFSVLKYIHIDVQLQLLSIFKTLLSVSIYIHFYAYNICDFKYLINIIRLQE